MGTAADSLVAKHPTRIAQLRGPVFDYLKKGMPYYKESDLYLQVFYPLARSWPLSQPFSHDVQKANPGIRTPADYVNKVRASGYVALSPAESAELVATARKLGVSSDNLHRLITFESSWNPQARNRYSGARGLIQFMPRTARSMGYKGTPNIVLLALMAGGLYYYMRRKHVNLLRRFF